MSLLDPTALARDLAAAWRDARPHAVDADDNLAGIDAAYAAQNALAAALAANPGLQPSGWKLAMSSPRSVREGPLGEAAYGCLFAGCGEDARSALPFQPVVEAEFAFVCTRPLPAGANAKSAFTPEYFDCRIALEIVGTRYADRKGLHPFMLIADNALGYSHVLGAKVENWDKVDFEAVEVVLEEDGKVLAPNLVGEDRPHPRMLMPWLIASLAERGQSIRPGDAVITGSVVKPLHAKSGKRYRAVFSGLGEISCSF